MSLINYILIPVALVVAVVVMVSVLFKSNSGRDPHLKVHQKIAAISIPFLVVASILVPASLHEEVQPILILSTLFAVLVLFLPGLTSNDS